MDIFTLKLLKVGARVGVYRKHDGTLNEFNPVVTIIGHRGAYLTTSQGSLLDPKTGVFFGNVFTAGPCPQIKTVDSLK